MTTSLAQALADVAQSAGQLALAGRRGGLRTWTKHGNEVVTSAEVAIHDHVVTELARLFPGVATLTEESAAHAIPQERFIVVDEIDGTAPYAAGADSWGVMIALIRDEPICGVVHLPDKQITIAAQRQQGCWINGERIRRRYDGNLRDAVAGADVSAALDDAGWQLVRRITSNARAVRSFACAAAGALEFLQGVTQLYINPVGGRIWDFAPIALAVTEAGGVTSTAAGAPLQWNRLEMSFLACATTALAAEVLALR